MKRTKFLLLALCALLLAGCSLARAEADGGTYEDRFIGVYVVPTQGYTSDFYDNPYLEEYGSDSFDTGEFGTLTIPKEVLFAVEDESGNYTFPGLETGFSLFSFETEDEQGHINHIVSNMGGHDGGNALSYTDDGTSVTLSGIVYCGPPAGVTDWDPYMNKTIWHHYKVYQAKDGRLYLTGGGNTVNGTGTMTQTENYSYKENGETVKEDSISVAVTIEAVPRMERLVVTQFDKDNTILWSEDLSLQNDRTEVHCVENAAWLLVEATSPDGTERTIYNVPEGEDPVSHEYVLLDDDGYGSLAYLNIYAMNVYSK